MANEELMISPQASKNPPKKPTGIVENGEKTEALFSPRFRSVAEMAGWDEEALMIASLIVEDTPDRHLKPKKRPDLPNFKTPPTNSRRKRRAQRSPTSMPAVVLDLDDDGPAKEENGNNNVELKIIEKKGGKIETDAQQPTDTSSSSVIPCIDRLREELSCAICLEICFEPSTTPCGHSFCKKCLRSAADKCGKRCPKCRQLISNGRSCTVNTVLWNTIQLLFPKEVEARKVAGPLNGREAQHQSPARANNRNARIRTVEALNSPESDPRSPNRRSHHRMRRRIVRPSGMLNRGDNVVSRRNELPSQDEDAALALRLQREEFMEAFSVSGEPYRNSLALARANLRAMASRATNIRIRGRRN